MTWARAILFAGAALALAGCETLGHRKPPLAPVGS